MPIMYIFVFFMGLTQNLSGQIIKFKSDRFITTLDTAKFVELSPIKRGFLRKYLVTPCTVWEIDSSLTVNL